MRQQLAPRDDEVPGSVPLKNPMFERLAREHASGMSMAQAFLAIGRKPDNAWRTFRRPAIQARVEYLRDEFNRMSGISLAAMQAGCCGSLMQMPRTFSRRTRLALCGCAN